MANISCSSGTVQGVVPLQVVAVHHFLDTRAEERIQVVIVQLDEAPASMNTQVVTRDCKIQDVCVCVGGWGVGGGAGKLCTCEVVPSYCVPPL